MFEKIDKFMVEFKNKFSKTEIQDNVELVKKDQNKFLLQSALTFFGLSVITFVLLKYASTIIHPFNGLLGAFTAVGAGVVGIAGCAALVDAYHLAKFKRKIMQDENLFSSVETHINSNNGFLTTYPFYNFIDSASHELDTFIKQHNAYIHVKHTILLNLIHRLNPLSDLPTNIEKIDNLYIARYSPYAKKIKETDKANLFTKKNIKKLTSKLSSYFNAKWRLPISLENVNISADQETQIKEIHAQIIAELKLILKKDNKEIKTKKTYLLLSVLKHFNVAINDHDIHHALTCKHALNENLFDDISNQDIIKLCQKLDHTSKQEKTDTSIIDSIGADSIDSEFDQSNSAILLQLAELDESYQFKKIESYFNQKLLDNNNLTVKSCNNI